MNLYKIPIKFYFQYRLLAKFWMTRRLGEVYFHGSLNGNLSAIVLIAFVAILTGSKPINNSE